jgi:hypothetical protein
MIWAVVPGTIGRTHGSAVDGALAPPMPAPPEDALAVGVLVHALGLVPVSPLGTAGVAPGVLGAAVLVPLGEDAAPPPVLALALEAPTSANAARLGIIRRVTRMSLS